MKRMEEVSEYLCFFAKERFLYKRDYTGSIKNPGNLSLLGKPAGVVMEEFYQDYIRIDASLEMHPEYRLINGWSNIVLINEGAKTIGYLYFKIYNSYLMKKSELLSVAKNFSEEEFLMMATFLKNFQEVFDEYYLKILVVSEITIDDAYLNKGYEIKAIIDLISLCRILEIDYIIVKPFPDVMNKFKHEEKKKNRKNMAKLAFLRNKLVFDVYFLDKPQPIIVLDIGHHDI